MEALSQDEILKVLKAVSDNPRDLAMILIAFRHGMRASEVCGLELKDVDLKNGEITIHRLKGSRYCLRSACCVRGWQNAGAILANTSLRPRRAAGCIAASSIGYSLPLRKKLDCQPTDGTRTASSTR